MLFQTIHKIAPSEIIHPGFISPYTQPYPGKNSRMEASPRSEPEGKSATRQDDKTVTYYGRTSSHSSLSEHVEDETSHDLVNDFEQKLDLNEQNKETSRIISRTIVKKELKAFPREDDSDNAAPKTILQKPSEDHGGSWDDQDTRDGDDRKGGSVWDERRKKLTVWNVNPDTSSTSNDRFFEDDYDPKEEVLQRTPHSVPDETPEVKLSDYDRNHNYHEHDNNNRRFMDSSMRKAIEETSNFISRISNQRSNITIKQKPVEILQKQCNDDCSNKPGTGNYWQDKQAERERRMEEEEREKREKERAEAQKARQDQYQDYRTPDQYGSRGSSRQRADDDRRHTRRRNYDENYDADVKYDRRNRFDKTHRYRDERSRSDYRDSRPQKKSDLREYERSRSDYRRYHEFYDDRYHRDYDRPPRRERDRGKKTIKHELETFKEEAEFLTKKSEESTEQEGKESPNRSTRDQQIDKPRSKGDKRDHRDRNQRHYDRYEFTYRRDPRDRRPRERRDSTRDTRRNTNESHDPVVKIKSTDDVHEPVSRQRKQKTSSRAKERVERYKAVQQKVRAEKPRRHYGEEEYFSSEEAPRQNKNRNKPPRKTADNNNKNVEKRDQTNRRSRKVPSIRYYSANPADKKLNLCPQPSERTKDKPTKEQLEQSEQPAKLPAKETKPKKEPARKENAKSKPESTIKSKDKEGQKKKKVEKTKLEMDRLKKMTQAGVDLLSIGIYAVDGKDLDDYTDGFVEVVRKKSKKDPEIEKMEKKPSSKSKKSKKSDKNKKLLNADNGEQNVTAKTNKTTSSTIPSTASPPTTLKMWSANDNGIGIMPNIWSNNNKQNAWDKPLSFNPDKPDTRDILAPLSGESSSLFSSEADLAKKTKEKDKYWKGILFNALYFLYFSIGPNVITV